MHTIVCCIFAKNDVCRLSPTLKMETKIIRLSLAGLALSQGSLFKPSCKLLLKIQQSFTADLTDDIRCRYLTSPLLINI